MSGDLRPAIRFREIVEQLGAEHGFARGWQARAAKRIGVSPSYLSHFLAGRVRFIGAEVLAKAEAAASAETVAIPVTHESVAIAAIAGGDRAAWLRVRAWADAFFEVRP